MNYETPYWNERCDNCPHSAEMHGTDCETNITKCYGDPNCTCKGFVINPVYHEYAKFCNEKRFEKKVKRNDPRRFQ